ncbi:hypothetical protein C8R44DRAFT_773522 [Mycena epipterygia]|nr:hypothetical protein C8R44DRAFT_773522 [Mycena epipterygia]
MIVFRSASPTKNSCRSLVVLPCAVLLSLVPLFITPLHAVYHCPACCIHIHIISTLISSSFDSSLTWTRLSSFFVVLGGGRRRYSLRNICTNSGTQIKFKCYVVMCNA